MAPFNLNRIASFLILLLAVTASGTWAQLPSVISIKDTPGMRSNISPMQLDLLMIQDGRIYVVADWQDQAKLNRAGIPFRDESGRFPAHPHKTGFIRSGINGAYHSYPEVEQELIAMENQHPELAKLEIIGRSHELRNIYALKISDNPQNDENEAEVLLLGCHHAREWISVEVPLYLARYLLDHYQSDPDIRDLIDSSEIWIVPLVNPDGLEYSIYFYRYWRKNRRDNGNGSYGVDLNRNYGFKWGADSLGSSGNPDSLVYRGPGPFSEPESQAVRDLAASRNFQALISYHNFTQVILFPWGYTKGRAPDYSLLVSLAEEMSRLMETVNGRFYDYGQASLQSYLINGSTTDWAYGLFGIPSFTVELPPEDYLNGGFFNPEPDILPICRENIPAALYLIRWAVSQYHGEGRAERPGIQPGKNLKTTFKK
jgi:carboxypeptidase T